MLNAPLPRGAGFVLLGMCALGLASLLATTVIQVKRSAEKIESEALTSKSANQRSTPPATSVQKPQGARFFVDGIPKEQFDSLTIEDLPNISLDRDTKVRKYNGEYILISSWEVGRKIIKVKKVDTEAILSGVQNPWTPPKGIADDGYETPLPLITDFEVIGDRLFVAASHQGIYEVDLKTNTISGVYGQKEGLSNSVNLSLATDGLNLWIGTFDGAGMLDPQTKKIRFFRSELLGVPCGSYSAIPHARPGDVWMQILADDGCPGGLSRYNPSSGMWMAYSMTDFSGKNGAHPESRVDFSKVVLSDQGAYAIYGGPTFVLNRFNEATGRWEYVGSVEGESRSLDRLLPDESSYHPLYASAKDKNENSYIHEYQNGTLENLIRIDGRVYFALARKDRDTIYLMSSDAIEKLSRTDAFPERLIPIARGTAPLSYNRLLISEDGTHLVSLGVYLDEYAGSFVDYSIAAADISDDSINPVPIVKNFHFEGQNHEKIDSQFDPDSLSKLSLKTMPYGYELSGLPRIFRVNLEKKIITATP